MKAFLIIYSRSRWETRVLTKEGSVSTVRKDKSRSKAYANLFNNRNAETALVIRLRQSGKLYRICEFSPVGISSNWSIDEVKDCIAKFGLSKDLL